MKTPPPLAPPSRHAALRTPARTVLRSAALVAALVAAVATAPGFTAAEPEASFDWPQFRGPERTGASEETGLARGWPPDGPRVVWRRPLGEGFSGISAAGGRLFTLYADAEAEWAVRLDPASGETMWKTAVGPRFDEPLGNGPRATPTVDGERVYVLSSTGRLAALAAADGAVVWKVEAQADLGSPMPLRGFSSSPLVVGDLLLVELGAGEGEAVVAFDKKSGERRWSGRDNPPGYASLLEVEMGGVRQIVFVPTAGREVVSLLPDGSVHWTHPWEGGTIAMPLFVPPDRIMVSASADVGAMMLRVTEGAGEAGGPKVEEVWRNRLLKNHFSSSVHHGGFVYGFDNGTLKCIDAASGEQRWAHRGFGKGTLITADGLLVVLGDRGKLALAEATPEAYRELGRLEVFDSKTWTSPTLAAGRLYLRDHAEVVCLEVGA